MNSYFATCLIFFCVLIPKLLAQDTLTDDQRLAVIHGLQNLREGKSSSVLDEKSGVIADDIFAGDEGLAYQVFRAGGTMLDNEGYTTVLTTALMKFPDRALVTFADMPAETRKTILETLQHVDPALFESKGEAAKFSELIKDLIARNAKLESKVHLTDGRPAFIDDPDGYTNLRLEPNTKAPIIDQIKSGEEFLVINESGDWCLVDSPRHDIAYVHKSRVHYKYAK